jgi:ABC-type multidrug transport system ATPase subunit
MNELYNLKNLSYKINNTYILKDISCNIINKSITVIKGHNGAGKTSFLRLLYGLESATSGRINRNFDYHNTEISYLFQNSIFLNRTVKENLFHILQCKKIDKRDWKNIVLDALSKFNLVHLYNLNINVLSGGELQLLAVVRSILIQPDILFLDEPTNNLDKKNINFISSLIMDLRAVGSTVIIVCHDELLLNKIAYNEIIFENGLLHNA